MRLRRRRPAPPGPDRAPPRRDRRPGWAEDPGQRPGLTTLSRKRQCKGDRQTLKDSKMDTHTTQITQTVYRRMTDPVKLFGRDLPPEVWVAVLVVILLVGFFYVGWMYVRDSRGVGPLWAILLGMLRCTVYGLLAWVFLLPARQNWEESQTQSKVVVGVDVSLSMLETRDDYPAEGQPIEKMLTRQEKVLDFLGDGRVNFMPNLQKTNPVTIYRFARGLDEDYRYFDQKGNSYTREEWEKEQQQIAERRKPKEVDSGWDLKTWFQTNAPWVMALLCLVPGFVVVAYRFAIKAGHGHTGAAFGTGFIHLALLGLLVGAAWFLADRYLRKDPVTVVAQEEQPGEAPSGKPLPSEFWNAWLKPNAPVAEPEEWASPDRKRLEELNKQNKLMLEGGFLSATNLGDAALAALSREINNQLQGIVLFTDGRSTEGSAEAFQDLARRAREAKVPIFVVAVGEDRPHVRIDVEDLRVPEQIQPEDRFRAVVSVVGEGLAEKEFAISLDVAYVKKGMDGKEELLPLVVVEAEDKSNPSKKREEVVLGNGVTLLPEAPPKFDKSVPYPRAEVEFQIDAVALAKAAGKTLDPAKKWEIAETKDGELRFLARVPKDRQELFAAKEHVSEKSFLRVIKRPLRVLLFASGPTREYQFLRTVLVREMEKKRVEVCVHLQPPPGRERRPGVVQDVPPERMLGIFPNRLDAPSDKPDEKYYDLGEHDVIIAFDPDWNQLTAEQLQLVNRWVAKGGGLIVLGGPINTLQLARPGANKEKLKPILDLYPVDLEDIRTGDMDLASAVPHKLDFREANPELEFLRLKEEDTKSFDETWKEFFTDKRGVYAYYPVKGVKIGAQVVARIDDAQNKLKDGKPQPYIVMSDFVTKRVMWIGSGELWRLRMMPKESYYERFWLKMARFVGSGNQGKINRRIQLEMGSTYTANKFVEIEAKIENLNGEPLSPKATPKIKLQLPAGIVYGQVRSINADRGVIVLRADGKDQEFAVTEATRVIDATGKSHALQLKDKEFKEGDWVSFRGEPKDGKLALATIKQAIGAIPTDYTMKAKPKSDGWFQVKFQVREPGEYNLELLVDETKDTTTKKFTVKASNPELDNTRPDFDTMYNLASEATEVLNRMSAADALELRKRLQRPNLAPKEPGKEDAKEAAKEETPRLFFNLKNAELIPSCMRTVVSTVNNKGPIKDYWDEGLTLWQRPAPQEPVKLSWVLLAVVGLLSVEWLTRKLLRLA
jgi:hypothetical protein